MIHTHNYTFNVSIEIEGRTLSDAYRQLKRAMEGRGIEWESDDECAEDGVSRSLVDVRKSIARVDRIDNYIAGLVGVSAGGLCPGCDECRDSVGDYTVRELDWEDSDPEGSMRYGFQADPDERRFETEESALVACKVSFEEAVSNQDALSEGSFSRSPCEWCGEVAGGTRHLWHYVRDGKISHEDGVCDDCVAYHANGTVPE